MPTVQRISDSKTWDLLVQSSEKMVFPWNDLPLGFLSKRFLKKILSFEETPFFREGFAAVFAYYRGSAQESPDAWLYLSIDERSYLKTGIRKGLWSLLALRPELVSNEDESLGRRAEVVRALFRAAQTWGELRGVTQWEGPIFWSYPISFPGSTESTLKLPELPSQVGGSVFQLNIKDSASILSLDPVVSGRVERIRANGHLVAHSFKEKGELPLVFWEMLYRHRFQSEMSVTEFDFLRSEWTRILDPDLSLLLEVTGEPAAAVLVARKSSNRVSPSLSGSGNYQVLSWVEDESSLVFSGAAYLLASLCDRALQRDVEKLFFELNTNTTPSLDSNVSREESLSLEELAVLLQCEMKPLQLWCF